MMPRGDLRVKFASFGKLPRMKKADRPNHF